MTNTNSINPYKSKPKTNSEDLMEKNTFLSAHKEALECKAKAENESQSNISTKDSKETPILSIKKPLVAKKVKKNYLEDYVQLDMLGSGSFGQVVKVQKKSGGTPNQFAMKIIEKQMVENVSPLSLFEVNQYSLLI